MSSKSEIHNEARASHALGETIVRPRAEEEYYTWKAMTSKLKTAVGKGVSQEEVDSINSLSDLEILELRVLAKLNRLSDASADLLAYYSLCGTSDRASTAKMVAKKAYRRAVVQNSLNALVDSTELATGVKDNDTKSRANRSNVNAFGITNASKMDKFGNIG